MNANVLRLCTAIVIVVALSIPLAAASPNMDDWVGTWIMNGQKSQYGVDKPPVDPALIRQILKIRVTNGNLDLYVRTELADGTDVLDETHLLDLTGKPHVTEFDGFSRVTETFKQLDPNTIEIRLKAKPADWQEADGELNIRIKLTISADRNTIRETKEYHFTNDDPNPAEGSVLVFDRQSPN